MPDRLPRPWLIAVVVTLVWWPLQTFWLSDDWIAVHWAADPARALSDFAGNQYGIPGLVWFYRPWITLGFALDVWIGGGAPFVSHLSNAIALGLAAMLLGLLVHRFLGATSGWCAALVWGTSPVHATSVLWAVGRTDSHTTAWILLSALLLVRWCDGRQRTRAPALVACALALCSKELAIVTPGIAAVLCAGLAEPGQRWRRSVSGSWPFFALLAVYFAWRFVLFGRLLGGYPHYALSFDQATGIGVWLARAINPWLGAGPDLTALATPLQWLGFLPAAAGAVLLVRARRAGLLLGLLLLFGLCALPVAQFWGRLENPRNLRYFTLAFGALATVMAAGRLWTAVPALALAALPHFEVRADYVETFADCRQTHAWLVDRAQSLAQPELLLVAGLPIQNDKKNVIAFHYGVDRMLEPPFASGRHRLLALRPFDPHGGAVRLPPDLAPADAVVWTVTAAGIADVPASSTPGMGVSIEGPAQLTPETLGRIHRGESHPAFVTIGVRASHYRVTVFTAGGYLSCVLPDESPDGAVDGRVTLKSWLVEGRYNTARDDALIALGMRAPVAIDLETRFPVWVEAGQLGVDGFAVTRAAEGFVWVEFDRAYVALTATD